MDEDPWSRPPRGSSRPDGTVDGDAETGMPTVRQEFLRCRRDAAHDPLATRRWEHWSTLRRIRSMRQSGRGRPPMTPRSRDLHACSDPISVVLAAQTSDVASEVADVRPDDVIARCAALEHLDAEAPGKPILNRLAGRDRAGMGLG
ncbi:hypothetical protein ACQP10_18955 [Streptosporangium sandarakinum]|uniref:hypothetical protein n=1 Tax=Streptosporangium sandarakinum TaxID=1260955 RepID=UPI003D8DBBD9